MSESVKNQIHSSPLAHATCRLTPKACAQNHAIDFFDNISTKVQDKGADVRLTKCVVFSYNSV